ncbi:hypothetical protein Taro_041321 [Colocasia esculenta]|uniref:Uncharacterized protein n=1 Tax=Colocasia esculenta TaxID=4460 RepID=A0A843WPH8_COLES|nr:hypothetical protein [Colocasia esculenta]
MKWEGFHLCRPRVYADRVCLPVHIGHPGDRVRLPVHADRPGDKVRLPVHAGTTSPTMPVVRATGPLVSTLPELVSTHCAKTAQKVFWEGL